MRQELALYTFLFFAGLMILYKLNVSFLLHMKKFLDKFSFVLYVVALVAFSFLGAYFSFFTVPGSSGVLSHLLFALSATVPPVLGVFLTHKGVLFLKKRSKGQETYTGGLHGYMPHMKSVIVTLFSLGLLTSLFLLGDSLPWNFFGLLFENTFVSFLVDLLALLGMLAVLYFFAVVLFVVAVVLLLKKNHWSIHSFFREFSPFQTRYIFFSLLIILSLWVPSWLLKDASYQLLTTTKALLFVGTLTLLALELKTKRLLSFLWGVGAPISREALVGQKRATRYEKGILLVILVTLIFISFVPIFNHRALFIKCSYSMQTKHFTNCHWIRGSRSIDAL